MAKRRGRFTRVRRAAPRRARAAYRRSRKRGGLLTGKGMLNNVVGALALLGAKKVVGENSMVGVDVGSYNPAAQQIGAGFALKAVGMDNTDLISAGIKVGIATAIDNYTSGRGLGLAKRRGPFATTYGEVSL